MPADAAGGEHLEANGAGAFVLGGDGCEGIAVAALIESVFALGVEGEGEGGMLEGAEAGGVPSQVMKVEH